MGASILRTDSAVVQYSLPLASVGTLTSAYRNLLHWDFISLCSVPCGKGSSCTQGRFDMFGLIQIQLLSLLALLSVAGLLLRVASKGGT